MNDKKDNRAMAALILGVLVGFVLWVALIILKAAGVVTMHWALVLSGLVWLTWLMYGLAALAAFIVCQLAKLKRWIRRRRADRRVIRQAKALGVWDKQPTVLGGRALELRAWKDFRIKREPGETDKDLRVRYTMEKIAEHFKAKGGPKKTKRQKKEVVEKVKRIAAEHGYENVKVKTDGYNVEVTLCDETVPEYIKATVTYETGGKADE